MKDRGRLACTSGSRAERLHPRIAGISPASGCTQPQMSEVISQPPFCLPFGKMQAGRPRSVGLACFSGSRASRLQAVVLNRK
ncbi:MAG: hypothetical protein LBP59_13960 [Planctomycetaceae bacterium]|nr:hypothetical protein [Planctomycetaceae bacterium]